MNLRFVVVPTLGSLTLVALALVVLFATLLALPPGRRELRRAFQSRQRSVLLFAWGVSLIAMLGSLYLSDGMGLEPCKLCWYQRIAMYPLIVVLGVAALRRDTEVWKTALPLCALGALVSAYHVMVQYRPDLEVMECSATAPCSVRYLQAYGFVSIPVMAGSAFLLIGVTVALHGWLGRVEADRVGVLDADDGATR